MKPKRCPFCGSPAHIIERGKCFKLRYALGCTNFDCWAWIPKDVKKRELHNYSGGVWASKTKLIAAWNRRANDPH